MDKLSDYITIEEAAEVTKKSISTIRRFVASYKYSKDDVIRIDVNEKNRPLYRINKNFILAYFDITKRNSKKNNNVTPELKSEVFKKKIINNYLYYKTAYITTKRLLIVSICLSIALIILFFMLAFYYKKELVTRYTEQTMQLSKEIDVLEKEIELNKIGYKQLLLQYDKIHERYNTKQDKEIDVLVEKINEIEVILVKKGANSSEIISK
jgi:hypothetical protein